MLFKLEFYDIIFNRMENWITRMFKRIISKLKNRKFLAVFLLLFFAVNIFAIFNTFTEKTTSSIWDGKVATKFKNGTGAANDPYVISNGNELAYFFSVINSEDNSEYFNKFYKITNNIDLNGFEFSFSEFDKTFSGNLDGNGYTIFNFKISDYYVDEETDTAHFSLFDSLYSANVKNINFSDITIEVDADKIINERPEEETVETTSALKKYNITFVNEEDGEEGEEEPVTTEPEKPTDNSNDEEKPKENEKPTDEKPNEN